MRDWWVFFEKASGEWHWERHRQGTFEVASNAYPFSNYDECKRDALHHGYCPGVDCIVVPSSLSSGEQRSGTSYIEAV